MGDEGAAEKVYEAGLELINPGGQPEVLTAAADAWEALGTSLDKFVVQMDRKVKATTGSEWRGPAADAFLEHWQSVKKSVEDAQPTFNDAAKGIRSAAENIKKVNHEIHQIYIEIGVTIAASALTSAITLGFSTAAGAANAARLATEAANAAARLGRLLASIARTFNSLKTASNVGLRALYYGGRGGMIFGREYATGVSTSMVAKGEAEWRANAVNAGAGLGMGKASEFALGGRLGEGLRESVATGALGGASGSVLGDAVNSQTPWGEKFDVSQSLIGAGAGGAGGGASGTVSHFGGSVGDGAGGSSESGDSGGRGDSANGAGDADGDPAGSGSSGEAGESDAASSEAYEGERHLNDIQQENNNSAINHEFGVAGEKFKEGDDDKLNPGQDKVADRLDHDRHNTSLVDDFG